MSKYQRAFNERIKINNLSEHLSVVKLSVTTEEQRARDTFELRVKMEADVEKLKDLIEDLNSFLISRQKDVKNIENREAEINKREQEFARNLKSYQSTVDATNKEAQSKLDSINLKISNREKYFDQLEIDISKIETDINQRISYMNQTIEDVDSEKESAIQNLQSIRNELSDVYNELNDARREVLDIYSIIKDDRKEFIKNSDNVNKLFNKFDEEAKENERTKRDVAILSARLKERYKKLYPDRVLNI